MPRATMTARDVRRVNRKTVLRQIYAGQPISRLDVCQELGLSIGTVTTVVNELLAEGIIQEAGFGASEGGRPRVLLSMNQEYGYFIGCELGDTLLTISLFDMQLSKLGSLRMALKDIEENTPTGTVAAIAEGVQQVLTDADIPTLKILGMGVGVPGVVEHSRSRLVALPIWQWEPVPLMELLRQHFQFPIYLENGSKTMALAERFAAGIDNMAFINVGSGVGAGIVLDGKLYRGSTDSAGEWGHTVIEIDGAPCHCGHFGCMEAYVGGYGILRTLQEIDPTHAALRHENPREALTELVAAAHEHDAIALQVLQKTTRYLGAGIGNLINLFNPRHVILGGWVGKCIGPFIMEELHAVVARHALRLAMDAVSIHMTSVAMDAAGEGVALLALEDFLEKGGSITHSAAQAPLVSTTL